MPNLSCVSGKSGEVDYESNRMARRRSRDLDAMLRKSEHEERKKIKILLLGTGESGKSTITKQMKIIHINGFSNEERTEMIKFIRKNVRDCILTITGAMTLLDIPLGDDSNTFRVNYIQTIASQEGFECTQEFFDHASTLWDDSGVQECFQRSSEYQLLDCAKYFLDRIDKIRRDTYVPTEQDILRCRVMTTQIQQIDFTVKDGRSDVNFRVFDVGGQRGERRKWIQVFEGITSILFLVDCSSYDLVLREDTSKNRLLEAFEIFEDILKNRFLRNVSVILFLNKVDILEEKVRNGRSLSFLIDSLDKQHKYFHMLQPFKEFEKPQDNERTEFLDQFPKRVMDGSDSESSGRMRRRRGSRAASHRTDVDYEVIRTAVFIKRIFMEIANTYLSHKGNIEERGLEYYYTCAIDTDNIRKVLDGCRSLLIRKFLSSWGID